LCGRPLRFKIDGGYVALDFCRSFIIEFVKILHSVKGSVKKKRDCAWKVVRVLEDVAVVGGGKCGGQWEFRCRGEQQWWDIAAANLIWIFFMSNVG
jgi:hypothetical protein